MIKAGKTTVESNTSVMYTAKERLVDLCEFVAIAGPAFEHVSHKSRTSFISLIRTPLQKVELDEFENRCMAEYLHLHDKMNVRLLVTYLQLIKLTY